MRQKDGTTETRYYRFRGAYLTGDCAKWNWCLGVVGALPPCLVFRLRID